MDISALAIPLLSFGAVATAVFAATKISTGAALLTRRLGRFTGSADATAESGGAATAASPDAASMQLLKEQKYSNWAVLNQMMAGRSWAEREAAELARADLPLRVGEFMLIRWICAAGLALVGFVVAAFMLTGSVLLGFPVAAAAAGTGYFAPKLWVKQRQTKRRKTLDSQLVESLMMLASSLRSGYSFLQGMEAIVREMPPPI